MDPLDPVPFGKPLPEESLLDGIPTVDSPAFGTPLPPGPTSATRASNLRPTETTWQTRFNSTSSVVSVDRGSTSSARPLSATQTPATRKTSNADGSRSRSGDSKNISFSLSRTSSSVVSTRTSSQPTTSAAPSNTASSTTKQSSSSSRATATTSPVSLVQAPTSVTRTTIFPNVLGTGLFTSTSSFPSSSAEGHHLSSSKVKGATGLTGIVVGAVAGMFLLLFLVLVYGSKIPRRRKKTTPSIP